MEERRAVLDDFRSILPPDQLAAKCYEGQLGVSSEFTLWDLQSVYCSSYCTQQY
jgi:hypothetical protein